MHDISWSSSKHRLTNTTTKLYLEKNREQKLNLIITV